MRTTLLLAAVAAVMAGCSGAQDQRTGGVSVTASALALPGQIQTVTITAEPGSYTATLTLDPATGQYHGSLVLPAGAYTLQAAAYGDPNGDGIPELIGTGITSVVVYQNQTTVAVIRILDVTGPPPAPDHGPFLTSVTMSNTFGVVSHPLTFSATAVDVDGDPIAYAWTETCASGSPSTFSTPSDATTDWTPAAAGLCTLRVTATSKGLADTAVFDMPVFTAGPEGIVQVTAFFVSQPSVATMHFEGYDVTGAYFGWTGLRSQGDATLPFDVPPRGALYVAVSSADPVETLALSDDCGGTFSDLSRSSNDLGVSWIAPAAPAVCVVTGTVFREGMTDRFPIAVNVGSPFTYAVSGTISGAVSAGVTVSLEVLGRSTTTDASGAWSLRGIPNGTWTLTPSLAGYAFEPASRSVAVSGANVAGVDFVAQAIALAPTTGQRSFFETSPAAPGWLPRFGDLVQLDASTHRGSVVAADRVVPFSWVALGGDVRAVYDGPRTSTVGYASIRESPAPPDVQDAYVAWYGSDGVQVQTDVVASTFHPAALEGNTYRIDEVQDQQLTWGPFDLNGQTYVYTSSRTEAFAMQLRERGVSATAWTPELAAATWALGSYYAPPGVSYIDRQPLPPAYNGDILDVGPGGVGVSRYRGGTFLWTIAGGQLNLLFADGSSETLEIVDAGADVYGLWSEHREPSGALVAGRYDWAFRAPVPPRATPDVFTTGPGQYWQQMINAWTADAWAGADLRWDFTFGWELLADGTGNNIQAYYDVAPDGSQLPVFDVFPLTWSVTVEGQLRLDRFTFASGENRGYRLLTPIVIEPGGTRVWVFEEEYRKAYNDPVGPYYVMIAPRITAYDRRTIPPPTPPAP